MSNRVLLLGDPVLDIISVGKWDGQAFMPRAVTTERKAASGVHLHLKKVLEKCPASIAYPFTGLHALDMFDPYPVHHLVDEKHDRPTIHYDDSRGVNKHFYYVNRKIKHFFRRTINSFHTKQDVLLLSDHNLGTLNHQADVSWIEELNPKAVVIDTPEASLHPDILNKCKEWSNDRLVLLHTTPDAWKISQLDVFNCSIITDGTNDIHCLHSGDEGLQTTIHELHGAKIDVNKFIAILAAGLLITTKDIEFIIQDAIKAHQITNFKY